MIDSNFVAQIDSEMDGDFFDHIDDLLNFSQEDLELNGGELDDWPSADVFGVSSSTLSTGTGHSQSTEEDIHGQLSVPFEDKAELEWLSDFVAGPFDAGIMNLDDIKESQFRTPSPVSVLESSSCSSKAIPLCLETNFPGRARTKRPRPTSFSGRSIPLVLPSSSENDPAPPDSDPITAFQPKFENFIESQLPKKIRKQKKKKLSEDQLYVRKCLHCEIQKTPQWRTGPMGPKTLCNACGVRYKSGRLYPEYRPAASPTFVPSKHSNSHKKVVEMRIKSGQKNSETELVPGFSLPGSEFLLQNSDSMMDYL